MVKSKKVELTAEQKAKKLESKKDAFIRVATPRVNKALKCIGLVGNCASSSYAYTLEQAKAIKLALTVAVEQVGNAFDKKVEKAASFSLPKV